MYFRFYYQISRHAVFGTALSDESLCHSHVSNTTQFLATYSPPTPYPLDTDVYETRFAPILGHIQHDYNGILRGVFDDFA